MMGDRRKERKTERVLTKKREERERRVKEARERAERHRDADKKQAEREEETALRGGDEKTKRSLRLYAKVFAASDERSQAEVRNEDGGEQTAEAGKSGEKRLSREEWLREKARREARRSEKEKFRQLHKRKTRKGQPVMKHRINHLLFKIREGLNK